MPPRRGARGGYPDQQQQHPQYQQQQQYGGYGGRGRGRGGYDGGDDPGYGDGRGRGMDSGYGGRRGGRAGRFTQAAVSQDWRSDASEISLGQGGGRGGGRGGRRPFASPSSVCSEASTSSGASRPLGSWANPLPPMSVLLPGVSGLSVEETETQPEPENVVDVSVSCTAKNELSEGGSCLVSTRRPAPGKLGQKALVRANFFSVRLKPGLVIYQYDLDINPKTSSRGICRRLVKELFNVHRVDLGDVLPVHDGRSNLFTATSLPFECREFSVKLSDERKEKTFSISIRRVATLNMAALNVYLQGKSATLPQEQLQALDIALRQSPTANLVPVARSFFSPRFGAAVLDGGLVAWNGFFQSLRPTSQGLALNVDLATTAFIDSIPLLDFICKKLGRQFNPQARMSDAIRALIKKSIVRLRVEVLHRKTPRTYRICGLSPGPTRDIKFTAEEGSEIWLVDYFKTTYNYVLRYPELPCVQVQANKTSYLPIEVCKICEGQRYMGRLAERQTTNLRTMACVRPWDREQKISAIMAGSDCPGKGEFVSAFGMQVSTELITLNARILNPPKLKYGNQGSVREIDPKFGAWNLLSSAVVEGASILTWAMISFDETINFNAAKSFGIGLVRRCKELGISMSEQPVLPPMLCRRSDLDAPRLERSLRHVVDQASQVIRSQGSRSGLQLLVCIMADRHVAYGELKRICETQLGVVSQCCLTKHVRQIKSQYLANLALKINAKVGGRNNTLVVEIPQLCPVLNRPTIIFGADVTHPSPGDDRSPSITALVANNDWPSAIRYLATVRAQSHREEMISDLKGMVVELWRKFCDKTGFRPERVIMFRDGVSEGQFDRVLQEEVSSLKIALMEAGGQSYMPQITWVIVQKRHHTRLFPADRNKDRSNNVVPGTVVDTVITHPRDFDFYLCSHAGIQGTSKPTHYHVIWDENGFSSDGLQSLINNLCYTYVRCTRSVSVVPPAYYAHLAAYRARLYIEAQGGSSDTTSQRDGTHSSFGSGKTTRDDVPAIKPLPKVMQNVQDVMYFC